MIGALRTGRNSKASGCWGRAGLPNRMSCGIFWRAIGCPISGLMSNFPLAIRKRSGCWKFWARKPPVSRLCYSRMARSFWIVFRGKLRKKWDYKLARKRIFMIWQLSVEGPRVWPPPFTAPPKVCTR